MVWLKWSIQLCIEQYIQYKRLHFVQKSMGLPVTGWTPDAVRTAIKIQSTFQRLLESCLLWQVCDNDFIHMLISWVIESFVVIPQAVCRGNLWANIFITQAMELASTIQFMCVQQDHCNWISRGCPWLKTKNLGMIL